MTVTWGVLAFLLHKAMFFPSRLVFQSSRKEEDAAALVFRQKFLYEHLPKWMRAINPVTETYCNMKFANRSHIHAAPDGKDHTRGYTISDYFADEAVYQATLKESLAAALPAIGQHGNIILVSSAGPSRFQELVGDD